MHTGRRGERSWANFLSETHHCGGFWHPSVRLAFRCETFEAASLEKRQNPECLSRVPGIALSPAAYVRNAWFAACRDFRSACPAAVYRRCGRWLVNGRKSGQCSNSQKSRVDLAVLEVGLGGRLDATNVASPLVSAIVSIDFDHEEYLGGTLAAIAGEKAGVVRRNRVVVIGPMGPEAEQAIVRIARQKSAEVVSALQATTVRPVNGVLNVHTAVGRYLRVKPFQGAHQRANLIVAIRTLEALSSAGVKLDLARAVAGMSGAIWPGRLERFGGRPPFLLDGAHNPAGARALASYLNETQEPHVLLFGAMRDKHVREMAEALFPRARLVIGTRVRMTRASTTRQLAEIGLGLGKTVIEEPSLNLALRKASRSAAPGETVVVAGSLYLVGAIRKRLLRLHPA